MNAAILALGAFNLVCTGTVSTSGTSPVPDSNYSYIYRVDLDAGQWCDGNCKAIYKIASIQPAQITLEDSEAKDPVMGKSAMKAFIDRETGRHTIIANSVTLGKPMIMNWKGQCERAPFTGFPKIETKF